MGNVSSSQPSASMNYVIELSNTHQFLPVCIVNFNLQVVHASSFTLW